MKIIAAIALVVLVAVLAPPSRFIVCVRVSLLILLLAVVSGCAPTPAPLVKTRDVEVTTYVRAPIPDEFIQDRTVVEPVPGAVWYIEKPDGTRQAMPPCLVDGVPKLCNGQFAIELQDYRDALKLSNADKASLRQLNADAKRNNPPTKREANPAAGTPAAGQASEHRP